MIRVLIYLVALAVLAYGGMWLVQHPGHVTVNWFGEVLNAPAALILIGVALAAIVIWSGLRFIVGIPTFLSIFARQRRREKGYSSLSRGLIAIGSGDARTAGKAAQQASKHLKDDPLALMLRAQSAHLAGDSAAARSAFEALARREDTRLLGLRGLHTEAARQGDEEAARHFAGAAHRIAPMPWSAQAVLDHRAAEGDWEKALATVETSIAAKLIDRPTGERQRAVLETAIAYQKELTAPDQALALANAAIRRAPDLAPPIVLAARLYSRRGDIRKAAKLIERTWPRCQHPDIARAYLDIRPGDSTTDRLDRARTLMGIASFDPVSRMLVARAAMAAKDFAAARAAMAPLIAEGKRPTVRMSLLMAELEEAEHGDLGQWREWLARAARAPFDPAWVADGIVYEQWAPASPTTGKLDAFVWQVPAERLGPAMEAMPAPANPTPAVAIDAIAPREETAALAAPPGPAPQIAETRALFHREPDSATPVDQRHLYGAAATAQEAAETAHEANDAVAPPSPAPEAATPTDAAELETATRESADIERPGLASRNAPARGGPQTKLISSG